MDSVPAVKKPTRPDPTQNCPCGSGNSFGACCDPILARQRPAGTAEELMRARFSAYVVHDFRFIHDTFIETAKQPFREVKNTSLVEWTQLVVHSHEISTAPNKAYVDFSAYGKEGGKDSVLHERAEFHKINGAWIYVREARLGPMPIRSVTPKVGRNEPCPCGSGKKYKQCCLR